MRLLPRLASLTLLSAAAVVLAGCGRATNDETTTVDTLAAAPPAAQPAPLDGAPAWVAEVRQREAQLAAIVEEGRLGEVHDQAHAIQGTLETVSAQTGTLAADQQERLAGHVGEARRLVDELHNAGDAGDLTQTRAKFEEFRVHLRAIEGLFGVAAP